jgi:glutathione S-transferase
MAKAKLIISSKNYSSWSLRGWLLAKFSGIDFVEEAVSPDDASARAELLLLSPSFLVPKLIHDGIEVWDTLAIGEYLNEVRPDAGLLPDDRAARAHCRAISGEMHSGFRAVRSALPMNLRSSHPGYRLYSDVKADVNRIVEIWEHCLEEWGGPYLFGKTLTMADAMYAPVATRFRTYDVKLAPTPQGYADRILALPEMIAWTAEALKEPEQIEEFESEF